MPYVFDIPRGRGYLDEDEARKVAEETKGRIS